MQRSFVADRKLIHALEQRSVSIQCKQGHVIFNQGEACKGLYFVKSGNVSLVLAADNGLEVMQLAVGPGSLLGVPAVVSRGLYTLTAAALTDCEVGLVELAEFDDLMREQPTLFPLVLAILAAGLRSGRLALARMMSEQDSQSSPGPNSPLSA